MVNAPVVVNVSSILGRRGVPGQAVYSASKAAVCSLGEALRIEWAGDSIAVCTLEPGLTKTAIFDVQPNPSKLPNPSMDAADSADDVARAILALDRDPRPEVSLRGKWRWLGVLSVLAPRLSDKLLVRNMGGVGKCRGVERDSCRKPVGSVLRRLRSERSAPGSPERARGAQAYMKSQMPYHGVRRPSARDRQRSPRSSCATPRRGARSCSRLARREVREEWYCAVELAADRRAKNFHTPTRCRCSRS